MENEDEIKTNNITPEADSILASDAVKKRAARKPRPLIEGINSPFLKPEDPLPKTDLTDAEKNLMKDQGSQVSSPVTQTATPIVKVKKPEPILLTRTAVDNANGKKTGFLKNFFLFILLIGMVLVGYIIYSWYLNRPTGLEDQNTTAFATPTPSSAITPTPTPSATPTPTPTPVQNQLTITSTPTGYLNVRSEPASSAAKVGQVNPGETYTYTQSKNGWYEITLKDGKTGWVTGQYVTLTNSQSPTPTPSATPSPTSR